MNFIDDVLAGRIELPSVPRVVLRLLELMRNPNVSLHALVSELEQDPVMSSRVLRMANSSFFGGRRTAASLGDAVNAVGLRSLQTLVIASGAQAAFAEVPAVNLRHFWLASVLTAAWARKLAMRVDVAPDDAYSAGLLQAIGHLILCQCHPQQAVEGFSSAKTLWGSALARQELDLFGASHPQVSAIWADKLGLPSPVVTAIAQSLTATEADLRLSRTVQVAAGLAAGASSGSDLDASMSNVDVGVIEQLGLATYLGSDQARADFGDMQAAPELV